MCCKPRDDIGSPGKLNYISFFLLRTIMIQAKGFFKFYSSESTQLRKIVVEVDGVLQTQILASRYALRYHRQQKDASEVAQRTALDNRKCNFC
jgi:hypothetical protein